MKAKNMTIVKKIMLGEALANALPKINLGRGFRGDHRQNTFVRNKEKEAFITRMNWKSPVITKATSPLDRRMFSPNTISRNPSNMKARNVKSPLLNRRLFSPEPKKECCSPKVNNGFKGLVDELSTRTPLQKIFNKKKNLLRKARIISGAQPNSNQVVAIKDTIMKKRSRYGDNTWVDSMTAPLSSNNIISLITSQAETNPCAKEVTSLSNIRRPKKKEYSEFFENLVNPKHPSPDFYKAENRLSKIEEHPPIEIASIDTISENEATRDTRTQEQAPCIKAKPIQLNKKQMIRKETSWMVLYCEPTGTKLPQSLLNILC